MAQDEIQQLQNKLKSQQQRYEIYQKQCKQMEEFLEQQSSKKEIQIRKLKQQAIKKEKGQNMLKAQLGQLETQNNTLKETMKQNENDQKYKQNLIKLQNLQQQLKQYQQNKLKIKQQNFIIIQELKKKLQYKDQRIQQLSIIQIKKNQEIIKLKQQINEIKNIKISSNKKKQQILGTISKKKIQIEKDNNNNNNKDNNNNNNLQKIILLEKQIKNIQNRNILLQHQNMNIKQKLNDFNNMKKSRKIDSLHEQQQNNQENNFTINNNNSYNNNKILQSCLIITKRHYISPFIQQKDKNHLNLCKNTKSGYFEKSLGCIKHKLDLITHDVQEIVQKNVDNILQMQEDTCHSIIIYGVKKSSKKYIMASIVEKLAEFIQNKANSEENCSARYVKQWVDRNEVYNANNAEQIKEILNRINELKQKNNGMKYVKAVTKPKIRYLFIQIGQWCLQLITTSHLSIIRDNYTLNDLLNNMVYSKMGDILQPVNSCRQLILTLNPIVSLYEECKITLSISLCREVGHKQNDHKVWKDNPVHTEQLNDTARRTLQCYEKQTQQTSLKVRKLQQDCVFYRNKFDELQFRLKSLLNTHNTQNSYLKKSPVTLSYEKMLKFIHNVQSRNTTQHSSMKIEDQSDQIA